MITYVFKDSNITYTTEGYYIIGDNYYDDNSSYRRALLYPDHCRELLNIINTNACPSGILLPAGDVPLPLEEIAPGLYRVENAYASDAGFFSSSDKPITWSGEITTGWHGKIITKALINKDEIEFRYTYEFPAEAGEDWWLPIRPPYITTIEEFRKTLDKIFEFEDRWKEIGFYETVFEYCGYT